LFCSDEIFGPQYMLSSFSFEYLVNAEPPEQLLRVFWLARTDFALSEVSFAVKCRGAMDAFSTDAG